MKTLKSRPVNDQGRKAGIIEAADFLQADADRQKAYWRIASPHMTEEYLNTNPSFPHVELQRWADKLRALATD